MVAQVMIKLKNVIYFIKSIKFQETGLFFVRIMVLNFMAKMKKVKNMKIFIFTYSINIFNPLEILMK